MPITTETIWAECEQRIAEYIAAETGATMGVSMFMGRTPPGLLNGAYVSVNGDGEEIDAEFNMEMAGGCGEWMFDGTIIGGVWAERADAQKFATKVRALLPFTEDSLENVHRLRPMAQPMILPVDIPDGKGRTVYAWELIYKVKAILKEG